MVANTDLLLPNGELFPFFFFQALMTKRGHANHTCSNQTVGPSTAASLKGKSVLVPSTALSALEAAHGPDRILHGTIKVLRQACRVKRGGAVCLS